MPTHTNRLARETSPYLLQHAHNPVDWYAWGPDAIAAARERGVPIVLSVGYSTCYWCHVMERESFEDNATARVMNDRYVCVKVDREERPDIDEIYMAATVTMTGSGGWPMSVFIEPDSLKPIYCGTYFPGEPAHGRPSFTQVLEGISDAWNTQRDKVLATANQLAEAVAESLSAAREPVGVGRPQVERAVQALLASFDRTNGGFGGAPKFPQPVFVELLLEARHTAADDTRAALDAAIRQTLDAMMLGGIHDHVGGGFHRYSVDAHWTVPHFEKMLYDNAQLAGLYARAGAVFDDDEYKRTARRTASYLLREMTDASNPGANGFFSAQDAEVNHREGLNYLWLPEEIREALSADDAVIAARVYGLDASPNFRDPHHATEPPRFVLRLESRLGNDADRLDAINATLLAERSKREQPHLDDKVLAAWNGLAIAGLVAVGDALGEREFVAAAERASHFVLSSMRDAGGTLLRSSRAGRAHTPAFLEDHAFMIEGLIALHRSPLAEHTEYLASAIDLAERAIDAFSVVTDDALILHDTRADQSDLFVRARSTHDGAVPSGTSVMIGALHDLAIETDERAWADRAARALRGASAAIADNPVGAVNATRRLLRFMHDAGRFSGLIEFDAAANTAQSRSKPPVTVLADTDEIRVGPDSPAVVNLALQIEPPFHIVAADPGVEGLVPLRVGLVSGSGVAVYADYPEGASIGVDAVGTVNVHTGRIEFPVVIEHAPGVGATPGEPVLGVTFQACTDDACQQPVTARLDVRVDLEE
ncbi:MAG: thioredoxin domain-containing protein [Phycisphaerales bacterium]